MTWQIWLAVLSVVFIVYGLAKRWETRMLLVVSGFGRSHESFRGIR